MKGKDILAIKMDPKTNDAEASTIKEFLIELLNTLWSEQEGFSGKRPFGNSSWEFQLYEALIKAGAVDGTICEDGGIDHIDFTTADKLIKKAIFAL